MIHDKPPIIHFGVERGDLLEIPRGAFLFDENAGTSWIPCKMRRGRVTAVIGPVCHIESERATGVKTFSRAAVITAANWKVR